MNFLFFFLISFLLSFSAVADSVNEILNHYYEAHGGLHEIKNIQSIRLSGVLSTENVSVDCVVIKKRPNKIRVTTEVSPRTKLTKSFNGVVAWKRLDGGKESPMSSDEEEDFKQNAPLFSPLMHLHENHGVVVVLGEELVDGYSCYHLLLTLPNGEASEHFIDEVDYLERKYVYGKISYYFKNFRKIKKTLIPFEIESYWDEGRKSVFLVRNIDVNIGVLEKYFDVVSF